VTFFALLIGVEVGFGLLRLFGLYTVVEERTAKVYMLFGKVIAIIDEPGLHFLPLKLGIRFPIVHLAGKCHTVDLRIDQQYLRSQPVNSEEGAPMGIGIWYEMYVSNPVDFLFKNVDPRGSLSANVSNATVRCLSNLKLDRMLINRHEMSRTVRDEVTPLSHRWGYKLGSTYIRKVHFRDAGMIDQIQEKVVNRLRQVTSAIRQDGANRVDIITSSANRKAAVEFARAAALRPQIVGAALERFGSDPDVTEAMFEVLEIEKLLAGEGRLTLLPPDGGVLAPLLVASERRSPAR
jgi:regulator of protease activity HflC (stomatin/prohibitin superfamily)